MIALRYSLVLRYLRRQSHRRCPQYYGRVLLHAHDQILLINNTPTSRPRSRLIFTARDFPAPLRPTVFQTLLVIFDMQPALSRSGASLNDSHAPCIPINDIYFFLSGGAISQQSCESDRQRQNPGKAFLRNFVRCSQLSQPLPDPYGIRAYLRT